MSENGIFYNEVEKVYKKPEDYELAGVPNAYVRIDAEDKVTGRGVYVDDIDLPRMLYAKFVRSPYAHAYIKSIDTSKALALPGVKCVITAKDFEGGGRLGNGEAFKELSDKEVLCAKEVRFVGDEVAAVCAVDEAIAEEAAKLVEVEYEVLPAVFDPIEALKEGAPVVHSTDMDLIHDKNNPNVTMFTHLLGGGDVDEAFAKADYTDHVEYSTQPMVHAAIEPHGAVAKYENGQWTIWSSTQGAYVMRFWIAYALGVPESRVRLIKPLLGGGFGGKWDSFPHEVCACKMAELTGRPVKMILSRAEVFYGTRGRHPFRFEIETAFTKEGKLLGKRCKHVLDGGAYGGTGIAANALSLIWANLPYQIPSCSMTAIRPYTNRPANGAMRGYSACQVHFAHDIHMDEVARELNIDPVELRRMNGVTSGYETPSGLQVTSCAFDATLVKASEAIGWADRDKLAKGEGLGVAGSGFVSGTGYPILETPAYSSNSTTVRLNREGYATVFTGANDIGQGSDTVMTMIVAEELGLSMAEVKICQSDTTLTPFDSGSYGSRVTFLAGNACRRAAADAKLQILKVLAEDWDCKPEDITVKDHHFYIKGDETKNLTFGEAVRAYEEVNYGKCIVGVGAFAHDGDKSIFVTNHGNYAPAYSFSTGAAQVKVDMETGNFDLSKFIFAHDCGRALNVRAVEGQIEGSVLLGLGFAAFEECIFDDEGRQLNPSFRDYHFPTALDMPEIQTILCGEPDPNGPFGAKEAGEGSTAPVAPAIANAISAATGLKITKLPLSPENIWRALKEQGIAVE